MSETSGIYRRENGQPFNNQKKPAQVTTEKFVTALSEFHWRADFIKFCEVLSLTPDNYAEEKYQRFQELISNLNEFEIEALAKMVSAGGGNK